MKISFQRIEYLGTKITAFFYEIILTWELK